MEDRVCRVEVAVAPREPGGGGMVAVVGFGLRDAQKTKDRREGSVARGFVFESAVDKVLRRVRLCSHFNKC